jgi:hypothetical protein
MSRSGTENLPESRVSRNARPGLISDCRLPSVRWLSTLCLSASCLISTSEARELTDAEKLTDFVRNRPVVAELLFSRPAGPSRETIIRDQARTYPYLQLDIPALQAYLARWSHDGFLLRQVESLARPYEPSTLKPQFYVGKAGLTNWNAGTAHVSIMVGDPGRENNEVTRFGKISLAIIDTVLNAGLGPLDPESVTFTGIRLRATRDGDALSGIMEIASDGTLRAINYQFENKKLPQNRLEYSYGNGGDVPRFFPIKITRYIVERGNQKSFVNETTIASLKIADAPLPHDVLLPDRLLEPTSDNYRGTILFTNNAKFIEKDGQLATIPVRHNVKTPGETVYVKGIVYGLLLLTALLLPILWFRNKQTQQ